MQAGLVQRVLHAVSALALLLPAAACISMSFGALHQWDPAKTQQRPAFEPYLEIELYVAIGLSILVAIPSVANAAIAVVRLARPAAFFRTAVVTMALAAAGAAAPVLIRVILPWEDPYDGFGSPLATLLGIIALAVLGLPFGIMGLVVLILQVRSVRRTIE